MRAKSTTTQEQLDNIMECRRSGLTVYQWCELKSISPTTYYNWISRLTKKGITIPESTANTNNPIPIINEVVQLDVIQKPDDIIYTEQQNTLTLKNIPVSSSPVVEILLGDATVHFFNNTDPIIIESTIKSLGGVLHGR